jgi:hypothetical protein
MVIEDVALDAYLIALRATLPLALRLVSLPTLFRAIAPRSTVTDGQRARQAIARSEAVARWGHLRDTCLYRAITRYVGLRAAGLAPQFVMAVRRDHSDRGHAWVELDGVPVGESVDPQLVPTFRFPDDKGLSRHQGRGIVP